MSDPKRVQRLYEDVLANRNNCRFELLQALLLAHGFEERQPRRGGSHYTYKKGSLRITIPKHKPVKAVYVKAVLELIEGN